MMDFDRAQSLIQDANRLKDSIDTERANEAQKPEAKRLDSDVARNVRILANAAADVRVAMMRLEDLQET